jgi:hypothetical protein
VRLSSCRDAVGLLMASGNAMFAPARADVAQLVEQRFRNPVFAPRDTFAPSHGCEHARP